MPKTAEAPELKYLRGTLKDLDTRYDREAVQLICLYGPFAVEEPSQIHDAVDRLRDVPAGESERIVALQDRASDAPTQPERRAAVLELEEREDTRLDDSVEMAYLLGMAVGRRLGALPLTLPKGGGR